MSSVRFLPPHRLGLRLFGLAVAAALHGCSKHPPARQSSPPVVAGLAQPGLEPRVRGMVLLGELSCVACHEQGSVPPLVDPRGGPDLATVGGRVRADYLVRFLADPHRVEPDTTMPDLLHDRDDRARLEAAEVLAQYLLSFTKQVVAPEPIDQVAAARGRQLFHEVGCVACHAPRDEAGKELPVPGSVPLGHLEDKYPLQGLRGFLLAPHQARPSARMPDFHLTPSEAYYLGNYLLTPKQPAGTAVPFEPATTDAAKVTAGRVLFGERGCGHCHSLADPERAPTPALTPLEGLNPARGCLSGTEGPWPYYALTADQRADLAAAVVAHDAPLSDEQLILQRIAARNCTACQQRGEFGGVTPERNPFFLSGDQSLGQDGRLPPPLTGVGGKLQHDWLVDAIAHGQSVRPYLRTRMPGFGAAVATELAGLLERTDQLPPLEFAPLPNDEKQARAVTDLGRELVGDKGMTCIACHLFAGERTGTMGAMDLVESTTQRLRRDWFSCFLREPFQFRPGTLMPQYFLDGVSVRPELANGDAARQIDGIWHYLAEGRNVGQPSGMRRPPIELIVGDEAVILRRSVQNTGKRGICVGFPLGVNLTFDAERLGMNQIWWGKFVDASDVWTGQGSGEARILGNERATLPSGPAFVVLPDANSPWPEASRRELGQQFLGYDLDRPQRPTFRYVCEGVTISDATYDQPVAGVGGDTHAILSRKLTFASAVDKTLSFRAARNVRIDDLGGGMIQVGQSLSMRLPPMSFRIRPVGEELELLVKIPILQGRAEMEIEYRWHAEAK